jgi:hypothetical protein
MTHSFDIPRSLLDGFRSANDLFRFLEDDNLLGPDNLGNLKRLLENAHKKKLIETLIVPYEDQKTKPKAKRSGGLKCECIKQPLIDKVRVSQQLKQGV